MPFEFDANLEAILDGNSVAFIGAGFSRNAVTLKDQPIKLGSELASFLAERCGLPSDTQLDVAAELFQEQFGTDILIQLLRDEFTAKLATPVQQTLVSLPWERIYTTNYDDVIESALRQAGLAPQSVVLSDSLDTPKRGLCVHLNGFVQRLNRDSLSNELKLTNTSYVTAQFNDSVWSRLFKSDVDTSRSVIFLGYSLYDLDIKRVLFASDARREKFLFVIAPNAPKSEQLILQNYGRVAPIGIDVFIRLCEDKKKTHKPRSANVHCFASFREITPSLLTSTGVRDTDALDLFLYGRCSPPAIAAGTRDKDAEGYYVDRTARKECWSRLKTHDKNLVVHTDLGNGKTMLIEGVLVEAVRDKWRAYYLDERRPGVAEEVKQICAENAPTVVAIESYEDYLDIIDLLRLHRHDHLSLLLSARSSTHDLTVEKLCNALGVDDVAELDANRLRDEDARRFAHTLDTFGLWGKHASLSSEEKVSLIFKRCHGKLQSIMIEVFDSPVIRERIDELIRQLEKNAAIREFAILVMILRVIGKTPDTDFLMSVLGTDAPNQSTFRQNKAFREIISVESGRITAKSGVLAEYLLRSSFTGLNVLDVLKKLVRYTHDHESRRSEYSGWMTDIFIEVMQFSNVQAMFAEKGRLQLVREYYEYAKTLGKTQKNPHFWLQYAVACLTLRDYPSSKQYFDTAYALARSRPGYDPSYIDNHYARFLLRTTIDKGIHETAMTYFNDAATILLRQVHRHENRHYPYRVATLIEEFFNKFAPAFSVDERRRIVAVGREVLDAMEQLESHVRGRPDVSECQRRLLTMIEKAKKTGI